VSGERGVIGAMPNGPVEIWGEGGRGAATIATALDLAAVLRDWRFGPGRFGLWRGDRCEAYDVGGPMT
jgi:hypothetical protein